MTGQITDYEIVIASDPDSLTKQVKEFIKNGWEPLGGVCHTYNTWLIDPLKDTETANGFCQAVVKRVGTSVTSVRYDESGIDMEAWNEKIVSNLKGFR